MDDDGYQQHSSYYTLSFESSTQLPPMSTFTTTAAHLETEYTFGHSNPQEIGLELLNNENCLFNFSSTFSQTAFIGNDIIFDGNAYLSEQTHEAEAVSTPTYDQLETYTNHSSSNHQTGYGLHHELSIIQPPNRYLTHNSQTVVNSNDSQTGYTCLQSIATPITSDIFSTLGINDSDVPMTAETLIDTYGCEVVTPSPCPPTPLPNNYVYDSPQNTGFVMQPTTVLPINKNQTPSASVVVNFNHDNTVNNEMHISSTQTNQSNSVKAVEIRKDVECETLVSNDSSAVPEATHVQALPMKSPTKVVPSVERNQEQLKDKEKEITHVVNSMDLIEEVKCFKCKLCNFLSLDKSKVCDHISESHQNANASKVALNESLMKKPNTYVCSKCFKGFATLQDCRLHMVNEHKFKLDKLWLEQVNGDDGLKMKPILPNGVSKTASRETSPSKKTKPVLTTVNKNPTVSVSSKKIAWKRKMKREKGSYICEYKGCNIRFNLLNNLDYHYKCHKDSGPGFTCIQCQVSFDHWSSMAGHLWRKHSLDMELYKCEHCSYRTYSSSVLENIHKRIHSSERNFVCDFCSKAFKNQKQLINHKVRHKSEQTKRVADNSGKSGTHQCPICSRTFNDSRPLRIHMNMVHHKLRPYICSHCNHSAASRSALRTHLRSHTGEKPFKCEKCSYSTSDHNSLRRHKMRHSGERPYKCPFCPYACIQSSTYKQHLRNKHPGLSEGLMFICHTCGFKTVNIDNYNTHMSEHKTVQPPSIPTTITTLTAAPDSPTIQLVNGIIGTPSEN